MTPYEVEQARDAVREAGQWQAVLDCRPGHRFRGALQAADDLSFTGPELKELRSVFVEAYISQIGRGIVVDRNGIVIVV